MKQLALAFVWIFVHQTKAFGRYALAKQHEDPLNLIDDYRDPRNITEEWPKAKEVLHPQKGDEGKKFGLQEVEVWLALASLFGAILALVTIQLIKLIRINVYKEPNILTTQSQQIVETVIKEGLESVSRTKKVVVMNLHFVPCDEGIDCCHAKMSTNGVMLTKEFHDHRHKGAIYDV